MMTTKDWLLAGLEAIAWYLFIYVGLYAIKNPVNLWTSAAILVALLYVAGLSCPLVRKSESWLRIWQKKGW